VAHLLDARHFGGAEQMVQRLIEAAPASGVQAWAYCLSHGRLTERLQRARFPMRVIPSRGRFDFSVLSGLAAALRADRIQVIQAHTSRAHLIARILGRRLGIPNVTTIQSPIALDENRGPARRHELRAAVERWGRPWTDHIVTVSAEERDRLIAQEGVRPDRISWIPNSVPTDPEGRHWRAAPEGAAARGPLLPLLAVAGLPPDGFVVAMIAQLRPRKGPESLIDAFAQWLQAGGNGLLLFIGDDEFAGRGYLDGLRARAVAAGAGRRIHFAGFVDDPWSLARGADLLALPSLFGEGLPLVLVEAMNRGLPILVSDTPGNRELVLTTHCGWLHPPGDSAALAIRLETLAADPSALLDRGALGRQAFLDHFTIAHVAGAYRSIYCRICSDS
jgi:glycosyltransferase involved in cell wall biosynthesis